MRVGDLFSGLNVRVVGAGAPSPGDLDVRVCDITEDSRTVMPGSLFVARRGIKRDGREYVKQAVQAGAVAIMSDDPGLVIPERPASAEHQHVSGPTHVPHMVAEDLELAIARVAERFYGEPTRSLALIGVTGTNGKTTITFLMHQMLNRLGVRTGLIGTVSIDDGVEMAPASMTTPPALELSRTFARMLDAGCKAAVMEVSSHALHQRRVGALGFKAGVFTNLTGDHLDYHKTMDEYAAAKAMLFEMLPADGAAVVNLADTWHTRMVRDTKARVRRCRVIGGGDEDERSVHLAIGGGHSPETVYTARVVRAGTSSTDVEFAGGALGAAGGARTIRVPLVGEFNVCNALEAFAALHSVFGEGGGGAGGVAGNAGVAGLRFSIDQLLDALAHVTAPPGRLEPVTPEDEAITVLVDYAHTDDALSTVLGTLRGAMKRQREALAKSMGISQDRLPAGSLGQLWCVFGCGGDRDRTKRPRMGRVAAELADQIVITSDNPRTEEPMAIIREVEAGILGVAKGRVLVEPDREKAIRLAIRNAKPGDTIIIAGKGHEDYQIFADPAKPGATITRHFDDREIARSAVESRGLQARTPGVVVVVEPGDPPDEVSALASSDWDPPVDE